MAIRPVKGMGMIFLNFANYKIQVVNLEPPSCKKWQKSPCQDAGLGNEGPLKTLNDTKVITND